jgi:putative hydrolase of the HAD superfamily
MNKLSPQAVIFDLGSTLTDFPVNNWEVVSRECSLKGRQFLIESGIKVPDEKEFLDEFEKIRAGLREKAFSSFREWTVVQAAEELFRKLGISTDNGLAEKFFDAFYAELEQHLSLYGDTIEVLTRIRSRFDKVGLISNTIFPERVHHHEFRRFGLKPFFDFTIFSSTFGLKKPHQAIFIEAARLAGHVPTDCVYIGDRYLEDVQGSTGAGMHSILKVISDREYPAEMPAAIRRISTLSDLADHLDI